MSECTALPADKRSRSQRWADGIAEFCGSWGFVGWFACRLVLTSLSLVLAYLAVRQEFRLTRCPLYPPVTIGEKC